MTTFFLSVGTTYNEMAVVALIAWTIFSVWFIGKIDYVQYFIPYHQKKKRRTKSIKDFEENFNTLRKKEGLTAREYRDAESELHQRRALLERTKYGPFHRYGKFEDMYERDSEGNKIPDFGHILKYDDDGNPVYRGKLKTPGLMGDRNELRIMLIGIFMVIIFIWFVNSSR